MANEDLKSQIRSLESELYDIERENRRLQSEVNESVGAIHRADQSLANTASAVRNRLNGDNNVLRAAHQKIIAAHELQRDMDAVYQRLKQMELANKRIRECNNTIYYDFAVYRQVRRIVQGMMDNLDFSMISDDVLHKAIERNHLENPDYWLTCVLVAVVAWLSDQRERAQRALDKAMRLDDRKTASFLMVFQLRLHREDAALKWFAYLTSAPLKGSEKPMVLLFFSMLSQTIGDRLSDKARATVSEYIVGLIDAEIAKSGESREQTVSRISDAFASFADDKHFDYDKLRRHVANSDQLVQALALARNNANIIDFIAETVNVDEAQRNEFLKTYIDDIVAQPCSAEQDVYDEIQRNEFIIKFEGDKDAAQRAYEERKRHDTSDFNIVEEMMTWIYTPSGRQEANPQMRKNMMIATRQLQQEAGDLYIERYRAMVGPSRPVTIDDFSTVTDLSDPAEAMRKAETFYRERAEAEKAELKDLGAIVLMVVGVVGGVALAAMVAPALAGVGVICLAVGAVWLLMNRSQRQRIDLQYQQKIRSVQERLKELQGEWKAFLDEFHENDLLSQKLSDRLAAL